MLFEGPGRLCMKRVLFHWPLVPIVASKATRVAFGMGIAMGGATISSMVSDMEKVFFK